MKKIVHEMWGQEYEIPSAAELTLLVAQLAPEIILKPDSERLRSVVAATLETWRMIEVCRREWVDDQANTRIRHAAEAARVKAEWFDPYPQPADFPAKLSEFAKKVIGYKGAARDVMLMRFLEYYLSQPDRLQRDKKISAKDFHMQLVVAGISLPLWFNLISYKKGFTQKTKSDGAKNTRKSKV